MNDDKLEKEEDDVLSHEHIDIEEPRVLLLQEKTRCQKIYTSKKFYILLGFVLIIVIEHLCYKKC